MRNRFFHKLILAAFFFCTPALAKENCVDPQTQTDMNICSALDYKDAEAKLDETYQKALQRLESRDFETFKAVQTAWLEYRDLNCTYQANLYDGGTIKPLIHNDCLTTLTTQRTLEITNMFTEWDSAK